MNVVEELRTRIKEFNSKAKELEKKGYRTHYNFSKKMTEIYKINKNGFIEIVGTCKNGIWNLKNIER
ncbi:MAG: hypothetical protein ACLUVC_02205 [Longibaculum sp.]